MHLCIDFKKISNRINSVYDRLKILCEKCYRADKCPQCIYLLNLGEKNLKCKQFFTEDDLKEYLSYNVSRFEKDPLLYSRLK